MFFDEKIADLEGNSHWPKNVIFGNNFPNETALSGWKLYNKISRTTTKLFTAYDVFKNQGRIIEKQSLRNSL